MADLDAYYQVLCKGHKDYHDGHYGELCEMGKDQLLQLGYNPKKSVLSDSDHREAILPGLPTEIIDLIFEKCDPIDAACLSLTSKHFHMIYLQHHGPYPPLSTCCPQHMNELEIKIDGVENSWFHRRCFFYSRIASIKKLNRKELMPSDVYFCNPCKQFHGPVTGKLGFTFKHDVPEELPPGWVIRKRQGRYPESVIRKSLVGRLKEWAAN